MACIGQQNVAIFEPFMGFCTRSGTSVRRNPAWNIIAYDLLCLQAQLTGQTGFSFVFLLGGAFHQLAQMRLQETVYQPRQYLADDWPNS
jgi:hypothetical protein